MSKHSMKLLQLASTSLLLGAIAPQTFAQSAPIVPSAPATASPVPVAVAPRSPAPGKVMMEELSVRDADVAELINMISQGFGVPTIIAPGVSGIILPSVNLPRISPEAAIESIAVAAGLKVRKQADGTYLIAKTLPEEPIPAQGGFGVTPPSFGVNPFGAGSNGAGSNSGLSPSVGGGMDPMAGGALEMPQLLGGNSRSSKASMHHIRIRNVPPSLMAFWIDPMHHDMPVQLQTAADRSARYGTRPLAKSALSGQDLQNARDSIGSVFNGAQGAGSVNPYTNQAQPRSATEFRSNAQFGGGGGGFGGGGGGGGQRGGGGGQRGGANGGGVFELPQGVDRVVAIDPQNALLVFGTDEGVRELTDTIAFLDRPLRQVEIEAQFVTVQTGSTNSFGINYTSSQGNFNANAQGFAATPSTSNGSFQVGFVRGNFQATLSALVTANRAKVITAPRVLAINNLTATLQSATSTPVVLTTVVVGGGLGGGVGTGQNLFYITTSIGLTVTPTINNDDTITVLMQPELSTQAPVANSPAPSVTQQTLETIANVRDGDTIALGGLKTKNISRGGDKIPLLGDLPLIGGLFRSRVATEAESDLIIFLTARIVRRAEDDLAVPGT